MKRVTHIVLVFENCETTTIWHNIIDHLHFSGINTTKTYNTSEQIFTESLEASEFYLRYRVYGDDKDETDGLERIKSCHDITQVVVHYNEDSYETYHIKWASSDSPYGSNSRQSFEVDDWGTVEISVGDDEE